MLPIVPLRSIAVPRSLRSYSVGDYRMMLLNASLNVWKMKSILMKSGFAVRFAKWGKVKIAQALLLKKISYNVCRRFLNEIDEEEYLSILDSLLLAKRKSVHAGNEFELNGKLMRFALSRGFEMKDISRCIQLSDENEGFE